MSEPPKSRLDREIDEILAKKAREPIVLSDRRDERARQERSDVRKQRADQAMTLANRLLSVPIVTAFALVIAAFLVNNLSHLLALVLCTLGIAALWLPGIRRLGGWTTDGSENVKYWRGRPYGDQAKQIVSRSPVESIKRFFDQRR